MINYLYYLIFTSSIISTIWLIILLIYFLKPNSVQAEKNLKQINISFIIPFKNEEESIGKLLDSLINIEYSLGNYEIILVNDNSTDNSLAQANEFLFKIKNLKILTTVNKKYDAKKGALQYGLDNAKYDYIVTSDADCKIPKDFLEKYYNKFRLDNDFVFGPIKYSIGSRFVDKIIAYESLRKTLLLFGSTNLGLPYSAGGANFGYRKKSFNELGGYTKTLSTLSGDDDLLIQLAVKNKYNISTIEDFNNFVETKGPGDLKDYLKQKARHTSTSNYYLLKNKLYLFIWHISNLLAMLSIIFAPINKIFILPFILKLILDFSATIVVNRKFKYKIKFYDILFHSILYEIFIIINYFQGTFRKITWK